MKEMNQMLRNLENRLEEKYGGSFSLRPSPTREVWDLYRNEEKTNFIVPGEPVISKSVVDLFEMTWKDVEDSIFSTWKLTMDSLGMYDDGE